MKRDPLEEALRRLKDESPSLPRTFTDQVMRRAALLGRPEVPRTSWFTRRVHVSFALSPVFFGGLTAAAVFGAVHVTQEPVRVAAEAPTPPRANEIGEVLVRFALPAPRAEAVYLTGDFNGWATDRIALRRGQRGIWTATVPLPPGTFQYAYVVDGRFIADPLAERQRPDGFGGYNAVLRVASPGS